MDKLTLSVKIGFGLALIGLVGLLDMWTGYEIGFSLFYVLPVSFLAWFSGRSVGLMAALASSTVWLWADWASGHLYSSFWIPLWNTLIRLSLFTIIVLLLVALKQSVERARLLARTDNLTGAFNSRFFYELSQMELDRFKRYGHVFSLAYIDLDNFKSVNDRWGHIAGDEALRLVAHFIQRNIRRTDVLARLGGDEFALLLPETDSETARAVCSKMQTGLLERMQAKQWPVTFSIGVLTCHQAPPSVDVLLSRADELMYTVKRGTKNGILNAPYGV